MNHIDPLLAQDGDSYYRRNFEGIGTIADPVMARLDMLHAMQPLQRVLEIGCTNGFRLEKIRTRFGSFASGLEAGSLPVKEGQKLFPQIDLRQGVAPSALDSWSDGEFDCIVLGFFGYLVQREFLFGLASEVDRLLSVGGHIVVFDFIHHYPLRSEYAHDLSLSTFKMDPSTPWTWSPTYTLVDRSIYPLAEDPSRNADPKLWSTVDVIRKFAPDDAYPLAASVTSVHSTRDHE